MTLDEAIEMHEKRIKFAQVCICGDCPINECIEEHQLHIEWLRELKAYREGCKCEDCKYQKSEYCNSCYAEDSSFWVYKGEVKADEKR